MSFEESAEQLTIKDVTKYLINFQPLKDQFFKHSIPEIPNFIKEVQPKAFEPMLVSLGPFHHGKPHLGSMELAKLDLFHQFLGTCGLEVEFIVESVMGLLEELRGSYNMIFNESKEGKERPLSHSMILDKSTKGIERFLKLMILDGCFVIEFLGHCPRWLQNMRSEIKRDMLMLENQLPMKLLDKLCSMANRNRITIETVQSYFIHRENKRNISEEDAEAQQHLHILDMYRTLLLYPRSQDDSQNFVNQSDSEVQIIRHATQLREAGIKFKKSKTGSLTDVSFEGSTLRLPRVVLDNGTESALLNVMAFEKLHIEIHHKVTSFVAFMDDLVDMDQDVALLASKGIIVNGLGDDRTAANLFNLLSNGTTTQTIHMAGVNKMVNEHCNKQWNKWCASLTHTYFRSPWTIISIFAAIFGFAILMVQAFYQIRDYYEARLKTN